MKKRGFFRNASFTILVLIVVLQLMPSVVAISLTGAKLGTIIFEPGKVITNHYVITEAIGEPKVSVGSGPFEGHIRVSPVLNNEFDLTIEFPQALTVSPGTYFITLGAQDGDSEAQGLYAQTSVSKQFQVEVYSYEKDIAASFTAPSVNEKEPVEFTVQVESRTYSDIGSIRAEITIYDWLDRELGKVATAEKPLPSLAKETLSALFDTSSLEPGNYRAQAKVTYDTKNIHLNGTFKVGTMDIIMKDYTKELNQGYTDYRIQVENNWGNLIKDVYAKLLIDEEEYLQTPSIDIAPWQIGELQGIVKVDLAPGIYPGLIRLFFSGEEKEESVFLEVTDNPTPEEVIVQQELQKKNKAIFYLEIALGAILASVILILLYKLWSQFYKKRGLSRDDF